MENYFLAGRSMPWIAVSLIYIHLIRVNSGNFGHQVNSDICLQTVGIKMGRLLIRICTVSSVSLFLFQKIKYETL